MPITIRSAIPEDAPVLLQMIRGLAEYENLSHQVTATEDLLREHLFGPHPTAEALIALCEGQPAGFAVYFTNFSTFLALPGLYLEDLFVLPRWRKRGIGRRLLQEIASIAAARGCGRFEWSVLDWNEPAQNLYRSIGSTILPDWRTCRMDSGAIARLAATRPSKA